MKASLRVLVALAWPVVLARCAQAVIGFCDALMTAPLGEEAVAAVTTGALNMFAVIIFPMGVVFIVQSFASQLKSRGNLAAARRYAWYGLLFALLALVLSIASIPLVDRILGWFPYAPGVRDAMGDYLAIRAFAVGAVVATEVLGNWYGGLGNTRLHMVAGLVAMVFNVALNWLLIEGHLGAPAMGVRGAALASVIASWIGLSTVALPFARGWWAGERPRGPLGLRMSELVRMLRFGLPSGLNWFLEFAAFTLFINVIVGRLGTTVLAAMMVVLNINSVSFMPAFGLASSGAILVGQAIGAGEHDRVPGIVKLTMKVAAVWQGSVGLLYLVFPTLLMGLFAPPGGGAELVRVGIIMLAISAAWQLFDAAVITLSEALRAAGDTTWSMWARVVGAWLLFIPAATIAVLVFDGGFVAAMLCMLVYIASLAAAFGWRFRRGAWRDIDLTGEDAELVIALPETS